MGKKREESQEITEAEKSSSLKMAKSYPNSPEKCAKNHQISLEKCAKNDDISFEKCENRAKIPKIAIFCAILAVAIFAGAGIVAGILAKDSLVLEEAIVARTKVIKKEPIYSALTGLEITDEALNSSPVYCIQIPNGSTDGARPQAGLGAAAVVFEAIAESGITRFAAIFQNADVSAIGPIRSLRPYYLDWDTPFDCTVTHAGGSAEAIQALRVGGQRDLNESYTYMWRESGSGRNWNNLFTSPSLLNDYNLSKGWTTSSPKVFPRMTPSEAESLATSRAECAGQSQEAGESGESNGESSTKEITCEAYTPTTNIKINFSANTSHNVVYNYDAATNTYLRSHQDGKPHLSYDCPAGLIEPNTKTACGEPKQVAPSVVVAMSVQQSMMADNYHQAIRTIGSGKATIFQNGEVITGTWSKDSQSAQIVFRDSAGAEIRLVPGQLWIAAVPQYGTISY